MDFCLEKYNLPQELLSEATKNYEKDIKNKIQENERFRNMNITQKKYFLNLSRTIYILAFIRGKESVRENKDDNKK